MCKSIRSKFVITKRYARRIGQTARNSSITNTNLGGLNPDVGQVLMIVTEHKILPYPTAVHRAAAYKEIRVYCGTRSLTKRKQPMTMTMLSFPPNLTSHIPQRSE